MFLLVDHACRSFAPFALNCTKDAKLQGHAKKLQELPKIIDKETATNASAASYAASAASYAASYAASAASYAASDASAASYAASDASSAASDAADAASKKELNELVEKCFKELFLLL